MDLGNMFFTLGISTKDFDKKMEDEIVKAKKLKEELQNMLSGTKLGIGQGLGRGGKIDGRSKQNECGG
jgi:hypothetical protein